jgi:hypothetical protein
MPINEPSTSSTNDSAVRKRKDVSGQERNIIFNVYTTVFDKSVSDDEL